MHCQMAPRQLALLLEHFDDPCVAGVKFVSHNKAPDASWGIQRGDGSTSEFFNHVIYERLSPEFAEGVHSFWDTVVERLQSVVYTATAEFVTLNWDLIDSHFVNPVNELPGGDRRPETVEITTLVLVKPLDGSGKVPRLLKREVTASSATLKGRARAPLK